MRLRKMLRAAGLGLGLSAAVVVGCSGWDPRNPFEHNSPEVNEALQELDAGRLQPAGERLEHYLGTGPCSADAGISLPPGVRQKPNGTFDLGLTLFSLGEQFGQRFGDEERSDGGSPREQALAEKRKLEVGCALLVARAIALDPSVPVDLRARAHYLAGNLELLLKQYEDAVKEYDQALSLVPGLPGDAGADAIGRDAAWNRAIALRRQEDQKDAGQDSPPDSNDAANDAPDGNDGNDGSSGNDGGDKGDAGKDSGGGDAGKDAGDNKDAGDGQDSGAEPPPPQPASSAAPPPAQDSRILEQLEQAPSYQGEEAKRRAAQRRGRPTMEDK